MSEDQSDEYREIVASMFEGLAQNTRAETVMQTNFYSESGSMIMTLSFVGKLTPRQIENAIEQLKRWSETSENES